MCSMVNYLMHEINVILYNFGVLWHVFPISIIKKQVGRQSVFIAIHYVGLKYLKFAS